jgi:hypothetical protein
MKQEGRAPPLRAGNTSWLSSKTYCQKRMYKTFHVEHFGDFASPTGDIGLAWT